MKVLGRGHFVEPKEGDAFWSLEMGEGALVDEVAVGERRVVATGPFKKVLEFGFFILTSMRI